MALEALLSSRGAADSKFVELEDAHVDKARNIPEVNMESRVAPPTPLQTGLRRSTRHTKVPERYSPALHYLLLTDSGGPKCYEEALRWKPRLSGAYY